MELYYSCERLHIVPALGDIPVEELTASRIQTFLYYLQAEKQLSRRTTSLVRSILIQLYDYAVEMSLAPINPVRSTKLPRQPQRPEAEEKVIPIAQREAVLAAAQKDLSCAPSSPRCCSPACASVSCWHSNGSISTCDPHHHHCSVRDTGADF